MQLNHRLPIHTISFNCNDPEANEFLIQLAQETGGRFHYYNEFPNDNNKPQQWESEDIRLLEKEYQLGLDNLEKLAQIRDECYLLRMKSTKSIKGVQSKTYQLKSLQNKLPSSDVTNSDKGSIVSFKQNQCKRSYSSHQSTYNDHNINNKTKAKLIHCSTVLFNQSKTINSKKSTIRKWQPIQKLSNDPYYPNLQSLCANVDSGNDFVLYETKQLLDRQSQRYNEAKREEISAHKTKKQLMELKNQEQFILFQNALGHHVVSEVLKQTLPIAYVSRTKLLKCPEIRLFNPLAINFEQYEKNLRNALFTIEKKLIEIIFQYLNNESLNSLCKDVHLDKYKKWRSKLCWYQDYKCIIKTFEKLNWPFPQHELILLTNELDAGQKYLEQVKNLKKQSCRSSIKCDNILTTRYAPCGHPYRVLSVNK
ncbi:unnamed protein product [Heterobilharzia americana]|nr:unnamed protein product [Heterobilharzia americana]